MEVSTPWRSAGFMSSIAVEDRGGAISGGRIDVLCNNHDECYAITGWYSVYVIVED